MQSINARNSYPDQEENSDYLTAEEVEREVMIFDKTCRLNIDNITYGHLENDMSEMGLPNLKQLFNTMTLERMNGIFTCNDISVALLKVDDTLGCFDSHSRGSSGESTNDGVACFVIKENHDDLHNLLRQNIPDRIGHDFNGQYQFTTISVQVSDETHNCCTDERSHVIDQALHEENVQENDAGVSTIEQQDTLIESQNQNLQEVRDTGVNSTINFTWVWKKNTRSL